MSRRRKTLAPDAPLASVSAEILDQFVRQGPLSPEELDAAVRRFKKAIIERALGGELTHHLGYPPGGNKPEDTTNHRNGKAPGRCRRQRRHGHEDRHRRDRGVGPN